MHVRCWHIIGGRESAPLNARSKSKSNPDTRVKIEINGEHREELARLITKVVAPLGLIGKRDVH